ncbi:RNA-dependent RNA polymerase [Grapevine enamovirus 1]|uniref:RNA-dependent RNA polymerase n=1 Tax=Grapevine enamovirus 1 TaxID=2560515 RepID=UPI000D0A92C1|nr:RNA-dependent RNA polymerase [Grapevine enamovirus 1]
MSPNQILIMIVALPLFFISLASSCSHIRQVGAAPLEGTLPMTPRSSAVFHLFADSEPKTMTSWEDLEPDLELSIPNPSLYTLLKDAVQESRTQGCATFEMRVNDYSLTLDGTYICIARAMGVTVFKWLLACRTTQYLMSFPGLIQEILLTSCGALLGLLLWLIDGLHICFEVALTTYFWFVGYLIYAAVMYKPTTTMTLMGMVWLHCWATSQPIVRFLVRRLMWPILTTLTSIHWALLTPMRMMISILTRLVLKSPQKSNPTTGVDSSPELCHGENCSCKTWEVVGERKESVMQGVHSLCLPAEPPKGCIAHFDYEDGSHCGFGVCVKLQSGKVAIAVPCHVLKNATSVWGPKGAIDVKDFTPLYLDGKGDMALITGAANWQSLCGFKPRRMLPITQVHTGPHNMFFQNGKGSWFNQPAMILGRNGVALRVKYNSDYGFSGLPIFDDRSRVVALHVGADEVLPGAYENKAGFLLDFPGVTTSTMSYKPESAYKDSALARYVDDFDYEVTDKPIKVKVGKIWYGIVLSGADQKKPDVWADADDEDLDEYLDYIGSKMHTESAPFSRSLNCAPLHRQGKSNGSCRACERGSQGSQSCGTQAGNDLHPTQRGGKGGQGCPANTRGGEEAETLPQTSQIGFNGGGREGGVQESGASQEQGQEGQEIVQGGQSRTGGAPIRHLQAENSGPPTQVNPDCTGNRVSWFVQRFSNMAERFRVWNQLAQNRGRGYQEPITKANSWTAIEEVFKGFYNLEAKSKHQEGEPPEGFKWAGRCKANFWPAQGTDWSEWGARKLEASEWLRRKVEGYGWPSFGAEAELRSLRLQAARRAARSKSAVLPSNEKRERVIKETVSEYAHTAQRSPDWIRNGLNWRLARLYFGECLNSMTMDSGAGVPYASFLNRKINQKWLDSEDKVEAVWDLVRARLERMLTYSWVSPEQAVLDGVCDPVRVFVKGEPHKVAKLHEGRFRIIASVSMVDQLVARMLFQSQNKQELRMWFSIPSKPGMGLSTDDQVREFLDSLVAVSGAPSADALVADWQKWCVPTDCSGFDWSVPMWLLEDDMECRNRLTAEITQDLITLRSVWLKCIGNSLFSLSDGCLLAQTTPGIQKSGSYNTSSSNSRMRVLMSKHAGAKWCVAMGDDAIESTDTNLSAYEEMGFKCEAADKFDFCSHIFHSAKVALPTNVGKMLVGPLCGVSPESQSQQDRIRWLMSVGSILQELRHLPPEDLAELHSALGL